MKSNYSQVIMQDLISNPNMLLTALAVAISAAVVYIHLKLFSFWSSRGIDGPTPWPIFGTNIYYMFRNKIEQDLEWHNKYGKTFGIYEGYRPTLRTTDNEILKHVYIKQFNSFVDRNHTIVHGDNIRKWLLWAEGDYWSNQRAMVSPMFTSNKMRSMMAKMSDCIDRFLHEVDRRIQETKLNLMGTYDEKKVDDHDHHDEIAKVKLSLEAAKGTNFYRDDMMALTLDVIAQSFFSIKIDTYRDKANQFLKEAYEIARFSLARFFVFSLVPGPLARLLKFDLTPPSRLVYFDKLSQSMIDERRRGTSPKKSDIIQAFLDAKIPEQYEKIYTKEDDKEAHYNDQMSHEELESIQESQTKAAKLFRKFSDPEIRGSMTFFFIAGFETTASTIFFCLFELAHQQVAQAEVYDELQERLGERSQVEYSDLLDMKKLDGLVSEVLRLYSPILENNRLVTNPEGAMIPTKPNPIYLPPKTSISSNFYVLQRDEDYFDNANEFQLSRFYPENRHKIKSCSYAPFGLGPRGCAGTRFALLEIKLCLAKLMRKYLVEPGKESSSYPPKYKQNAIFLQLKSSDFKLIPRN